MVVWIEDRIEGQRGRGRTESDMEEQSGSGRTERTSKDRVDVEGLRGHGCGRT